MTTTKAIPYEIIRKPKLKHLYLRIKEGRVIITANNRVSSSYIESFVQSKAVWIEKRLGYTDAKKYLLTQADAKIYFLGDTYNVSIETSISNAKPSIILDEDKAYFYLKDNVTHDTLMALRDTYYKSHCSTTITPLVEQYAKEMGLHPTKIGYRHNTSRWGSCSSRNALSLNTRLMMLPEPLITYVVIHELAHIKEKNHSKHFWLLVEKYCPDYKELRRRLRSFESFL